MENINLRLESIQGNEIIIREGEALKPVPPKKIELTGDIKTVTEFIGKRKALAIAGISGAQYIEPTRAVVEVDKIKRTITLSLDPENINGTVVTAKLEPNPDLEQFHINGKKQFSQRELINLLKFSRLYFEDFGKHGDLLKAYTAFTAKTYTDLANDSDSRGNKNFGFTKKVETGLPATFIMNMPVFKGQESRRFMVEICLDVTDAAASFWFESVELAEIMEMEGEKILRDELKACDDYVVIWK
jgi:hypothetical protein